MLLGLLVIAQALAPSQVGGQRDMDLCTGKFQSDRERSIAACRHVVAKELLDKKQIAEAYLMLARWASDPAGAIQNPSRLIRAMHSYGARAASNIICWVTTTVRLPTTRRVWQ